MWEPWDRYWVVTERDRAGYPTALRALDSMRVQIVRDNRGAVMFYREGETCHRPADVLIPGRSNR